MSSRLAPAGLDIPNKTPDLYGRASSFCGFIEDGMLLLPGAILIIDSF